MVVRTSASLSVAKMRSITGQKALAPGLGGSRIAATLNTVVQSSSVLAVPLMLAIDRFGSGLCATELETSA